MRKHRGHSNLHIEGGDWAGRKLLAPPKSAVTRPITGLAKKSLFGTLLPWLAEGARILDLYCGTGTLGLEALSRGARLCWFAENDRPVLRRLERNIADCNAEDRCVVWDGNIETQLATWLATLEHPVDVVFLDPPYAHARQWDWSRLTERMFAPLSAALADDGVVVLRTDKHTDTPETFAELRCRRRKEFGSMHIHYLQPD